MQRFLDAVCAQIRWKEAHKSVIRELGNHVADQAEAFQEEGMEEADAIREALREMGDPVETGRQLDRVYRPRPDWRLLTLTAALGFIISLSAVLTVATQSVFYVLNNLGVCLFDATLPLLSYGRASFFVNMGLIGLMLSVCRRSSLTVDTPVTQGRQGQSGGLLRGRYTFLKGRLIIDMTEK